ncbi:uncharacterized protein LOC122638643 [Telopea speciosissima]|uniref:uncharacterized protein LOC122638643 n=1 Tax=Telopea speciosissima TaxID=54955 RepID=UPI001CC33554|nr:uncharacterized protein LOC122638643 [Telopea speciosissima]
MASGMVSVVVVFVFNLVAFILAIGAELRRSTARVTTDINKNYYYCLYDSDIATKLGMGASLLLMASQVLVMMQARFFCLDKALNPKVSRAWAITLFFGCWVTFSVAEICLVGGSLVNAQHTRYRTIFGGFVGPSCQTLGKGVFSAGAAFVVLTTICTQFYYLYYTKAITDQLSSDQFTQEPLITTVVEAAEQT